MTFFDTIIFDLRQIICLSITLRKKHTQDLITEILQTSTHIVIKFYIFLLIN